MQINEQAKRFKFKNSNIHNPKVTERRVEKFKYIHDIVQMQNNKFKIKIIHPSLKITLECAPFEPKTLNIFLVAKANSSVIYYRRSKKTPYRKLINNISCMACTRFDDIQMSLFQLVKTIEKGHPDVIKNKNTNKQMSMM